MADRQEQRIEKWYIWRSRDKVHGLALYIFLDKSRQSLQGKNTKAGLRMLKGYTKMLNCECPPGKMVSNVRETVVNIEIDYKVGPFI